MRSLAPEITLAGMAGGGGERLIELARALVSFPVSLPSS